MDNLNSDKNNILPDIAIDLERENIHLKQKMIRLLEENFIIKQAFHLSCLELLRECNDIKKASQRNFIDKVRLHVVEPDYEDMMIKFMQEKQA